MRIGIVDDERPARSELKHQLLELIPEAEIVEGDSGAAALQLAGGEKLDLFFLDINLGDINGTVLIEALKNMQPDMKIVFVTAYSEYAVKAFELGVADYVMKPYDKKRLQKMIDKCCIGQGEWKEKPVPARNPKRIAINSNGRTLFEDVDRIIYVETYNRGCLIHTLGDEYFEGKSIGEYEKRLDAFHFFRIHKSYLINLDQVREVFPWGNNSFALKMRGYEQNILPVGREKTKILRQLLGW
ncbi:LytTR family DNA-binding domain-containing protein [Lachnospiraceae bacterium 62-35]